ncbi:histidine kinase [Methylobacterium sp. Leaf111]|uniref:ATP-binding protein n=1 Tax=unclassified Methylobacterium TaxID=2615210 RepID=UPI0006F3B694|nr:MULTISPECIES: ATP-binding protein [unclassified Methylobacterium]KQO68285.1 histidine kinase [Methylobacterium sp. Leaf89]KQP74850.1 histidine kinase [Methylobacterium sp. Leaf111]
MRRLFALSRSLEARTLVVLLVAILAVHGGALLLYRRSAAAASAEAFAAQVATQLALAREAVMRRPPAARNAEAQALSNPHFEVAWTDAPAPAGRRSDPALEPLHQRLTALDPSLGPNLSLVMEGDADPLHRLDLGGTLALPDGSQLTFHSAHASGMALSNPWAMLATAMAILVGLAAVLLTHRIARPLRALGHLTGLIGHAVGQGRVVPVPEVGPDETRAIARALNGMQMRIRDLVTERTQALAAVSHDLRTPIARLRLRLDGVADDGQRHAMASDLDDMQAMIDSTLAYLRGDADPEVRRVTNVASLLMSIADAGQDAGHAVVYEGPGRALAAIRPVALRRALDNVVDNAVRYGDRARIGLALADASLELWIDDDGPGLPADAVDRAFAPFTRLETSRNRNTGGTGLGLTIARRVIEAEGGRIGLETRSGGGLRVRITLPRPVG